MPHNKDYNVQLVKKLYSYVPAFTDVFDEESWYIFISGFVGVTVIVFILLAKFVKLKPVDW